MKPASCDANTEGADTGGDETEGAKTSGNIGTIGSVALRGTTNGTTRGEFTDGWGFVPVASTGKGAVSIAGDSVVLVTGCACASRPTARTRRATTAMYVFVVVVVVVVVVDFILTGFPV